MRPGSSLPRRLHSSSEDCRTLPDDEHHLRARCTRPARPANEASVPHPARIERRLGFHALDGFLDLVRYPVWGPIPPRPI